MQRPLLSPLQQRRLQNSAPQFAMRRHARSAAPALCVAAACAALFVTWHSLPGYLRIELRADRHVGKLQDCHKTDVLHSAHAPPWWPDPYREARSPLSNPAERGWWLAPPSSVHQHAAAGGAHRSVLETAARDNVTGLRGAMIHMPKDGWKLERMGYASLPFRPSLVPGINLSAPEGPATLAAAEAAGLVRALPPLLRGNLGAALSHLALWEEVARQKERVLIFEDNVLFKPESLRKAKEYLAAVPDADFVNLEPGTPEGGAVDAHADLLAIETRSSAVPRSSWLHGWPRNTKNCWLSTYMISPRGARRLLHGFRVAGYDLSRTIIDRAVPYHWIVDGCSTAYVTRMMGVFGHAETPADSRKALNAG